MILGCEIQISSELTFEYRIKDNECSNAPCCRCLLAAGLLTAPNIPLHIYLFYFCWQWEGGEVGGRKHDIITMNLAVGSRSFGTLCVFGCEYLLIFTNQCWFCGSFTSIETLLWYKNKLYTCSFVILYLIHLTRFLRSWCFTSRSVGLPKKCLRSGLVPSFDRH